MIVPAKVGDTVRLRRNILVGVIPEGRQDNRSAKVQAVLHDYAPGALRLDRDLRGCRYWNRADVQLVRSTKG